ncbi:hypothetical protein ABIE65_002605 [Constrictibacter sp. MBR-5]|jgi:hypothetical protein|uniref:hypothetical protein n=1 Tax=Constrictibacter sp. MBR-5 TaxID=3156467 RepID=UPI0033922AD7
MNKILAKPLHLKSSESVYGGLCLPAVAVAAVVVAAAPWSGAEASARLAAAADTAKRPAQQAAADPAALVGRSVTMHGKRIGEIVDTITDAGTPNDVLVRLDRQHRQMGLVLGPFVDRRVPGNEAPVIIGGSVIALPMEALVADPGSGSVRLSERAVTTLGELSAR